jgi:hypothetical protein
LPAPTRVGPTPGASHGSRVSLPGLSGPPRVPFSTLAPSDSTLETDFGVHEAHELRNSEWLVIMITVILGWVAGRGYHRRRPLVVAARCAAHTPSSMRRPRGGAGERSHRRRLFLRRNSLVRLEGDQILDARTERHCGNARAEYSSRSRQHQACCCAHRHGATFLVRIDLRGQSHVPWVTHRCEREASSASLEHSPAERFISRMLLASQQASSAHKRGSDHDGRAMRGFLHPCEFLWCFWAPKGHPWSYSPLRTDSVVLAHRPSASTVASGRHCPAIAIER